MLRRFWCTSSFPSYLCLCLYHSENQALSLQDSTVARRMWRYEKQFINLLMIEVYVSIFVPLRLSFISRTTAALYKSALIIRRNYFLFIFYPQSVDMIPTVRKSTFWWRVVVQDISRGKKGKYHKYTTYYACNWISTVNYTCVEIWLSFRQYVENYKRW